MGPLGPRLANSALAAAFYEAAKNKVYNEVSNYDAGKSIEDAVADFAGELLGDAEWIKNNYSSVFGDGVSYDGNIDTE